MQKIPRIPGTEGSRRADWVAIVGLITLGLVLGLGSTPGPRGPAHRQLERRHPGRPYRVQGGAKDGDHRRLCAGRHHGRHGDGLCRYHPDRGDHVLLPGPGLQCGRRFPVYPEGCAVAPTAVLRTLTVAKSGTGTGTVDTSPAGITCGSTCSATYASGTSVALSATPNTGSTFTGWSGACTGTGGCALVLDANKSATATFALSTAPTSTLTVSKSGTGTGTVTSSPSGITCGSTCSASYNSGTSVTLTAAASFGSTFSGWSGACRGTGTCTVSMNAAKSATATFALSTATPAPLPYPASPPPRGARWSPGRRSPSPRRQPGAPPPISSSGGSGTGAPGPLRGTGGPATLSLDAAGAGELRGPRLGPQ